MLFSRLVGTRPCTGLCVLLLCPLQSGVCGPGIDMGVSGDTEDKELEVTLVEDGTDISQYCIIQSFVIVVYFVFVCLNC